MGVNMKEYFKKIDQKQIRLLLLVVIVLILFIGYQFGYAKYNDKTSKVEEKNIELTTRYNELSGMVAMEATFDANKETYYAEMEAIKEKYGPGNSPEKSIRFLNDLSGNVGVLIPTVSLSSDENIFSSALVPSKDATGIFAYRTTLGIT
jgi:hypothetical protein